MWHQLLASETFAYVSPCQASTEKKYKHKMVQELRKNGLRKGSWTEAEDKLLRKCIQKYGEGKWHQVPLRAGLSRCRKSCRLRWLNYLRPNIKRGQFAPDEVDLIIRMHKLLGNRQDYCTMLTNHEYRWALIAGRLPGRTANDIKNFWNTHVNRKTALEDNSGTNTDRQGGHPMERKLVIKPQALAFSKNSSWIKRRRTGYNTSSTTNNEPLSLEKEMLTTSCKGLPEFLNGRDEASTSSFWWESILSDHTQKLEQEIAADINKSSSYCNMTITGSKEDNPNTDLWIHDNLVTANSSMAGDKNTMELVKSSDLDHLFLDDNLWATLSEY